MLSSGLAPPPKAPEPVPAEKVPSSSKPTVKSEPVDPLQMDIEEDDLNYEPDSLDAQVYLLFVLHKRLLMASKASGSRWCS